jgi:hypothetical protein
MGGSDARPSELPPEGRKAHPLRGPKGARIQIDGRSLISVLVERVTATGLFDPIIVVGPAAAYGPLALPIPVVDADGSFGDNVQVAVSAMRRAHPGRSVAFLACDVLPDGDALGSMMACYRRCNPCDLFFPMIRAPDTHQALGASAWKPRYRILPADGEEPVYVLPGHLLVADLDALRLDFLYRLFQLAYRTRNRPLGYRRGVLFRGVIAELLRQDLLHLLSLRAPSLTWSVLVSAFSAARALEEGTLTRIGLEKAIRRILITSRHRKRYPERGVRMPILDALSIALDLDTTEEVDALGGTLRPDDADGRAK